MHLHRTLFLLYNDLLCPPRGVCYYRCPKRLRVDIVALHPLVTMGIVLR